MTALGDNARNIENNQPRPPHFPRCHCKERSDVAIQRPRTITPRHPASAPATPHRKGETHRLGIPHDGFAKLPRHVVARNDSLGGRIATASHTTSPTGLPRQFSTRPSSQGQCWGIRPKYRDEPPRQNRLLTDRFPLTCQWEIPRTQRRGMLVIKVCSSDLF